MEDIHTYTEIPEKIADLPVSEWKKFVEDSVVKYGITWINPRYVGNNPEFNNGRVQPDEERETNEDSVAAGPKRRKREVTYVWYADYKCHRYGVYRDKIAEGTRTKGGATGSVRALQKASKKSDCKARLKITCFKSDPTVVEVHHIGVHNHEVGSVEDMKYLPLSQKRKDAIMERLREGYNKRDCRIAIQKDFRKFTRDLLTSSDPDHVFHRDQIVHQDEVYNIYKKIQEAFYRKSTDEKESVKMWLQELNQKGYSSFVHSTFEDDFTFGFSSPWQKNLLLNSKMVCLDATHCVSHIEKGILYTIVIRHPISGTGCPVAYMFTKDHSMAAVSVFLSFVKNDIGVPSLDEITIDVSATEHAAITAIYPESTVQWCLFHVSRAWMGKIRELIKLGSTALNNQVHRNVITDLKLLMWEKNEEVFLLGLISFRLKYSMYQDFLNYMDRAYLNRGKFVHWSAAFQPQVFSNMETNNYIESWHNQLKTTYLGRKRNRRVDRLIYILVNDIEPDYINNVCRISANVGRMGPEERRRRKRELEAENINEAILNTLVTAPENESNVYTVKSFSDNHTSYEIEVINQKMNTCSCPDFQFNKIACKHMYLLRRLYKEIAVHKGQYNSPNKKVTRQRMMTLTKPCKLHSFISIFHSFNCKSTNSAINNNNRNKDQKCYS
ncbi:unnamed protein product [Mucor hiemalis]